MSEIRGVAHLDVLQQACIQVFGEGKFAFLANKDSAEDAERCFGPQAEQLDNAPWGLNEYQHLHSVARWIDLYTVSLTRRIGWNFR